MAYGMQTVWGIRINMSARAATKMARAETLARLPPDDVLFGCSSAMNEVRHKALKICRTNVAVLLLGEGGTGKETLARWLHANSEYASGEFVKVNCAAIPGSLLESELFGHERGAFTGAQAAKPGRVERAHLGTLFLDEVGDLDFGLQSKLLHFLQDGYFSRLGDEIERTVETRVICATSRSIENEIAAGRFRADFYYRINVLKIVMPKLADRRGGIPPPGENFLNVQSPTLLQKSRSVWAENLAYLQNVP